VRLLYDQNLSPRLCQLLAAEFPSSLHVRDVGLARADDASIWDYAGVHGLTIVTKDDDFRQRSFVFGPPPRVVWVRLGNCTTLAVASLLRTQRDRVISFCADLEAALLVLSVEEAG